MGKEEEKREKEDWVHFMFLVNKIIVFNDVREAYPYINNIALEKEVYALFENDLPDTYNE